MNIQQNRKLAAVFLLAVILLIGIQQIQSKEELGIVVQQNVSETPENSFSPSQMQKNEIVVHVAGAVKNPGVYRLEEGMRIEDAIQKAEITETADADALNRAALLTDGQKIVVPFLEETHTINQQEMPTASDSPSAGQNAKVNLNQATAVQLMELPGIGEVKANAIIRYRQENGGFQNIDELLMVNGIGSAIYAQIAELVAV